MPIIRGGLRFLLSALFRIKVSGVENIPSRGVGFILAGAPHRNWVEPLLMHAYVAPRGRRVFTVADARAVSGNVIRRLAARSVGGVIRVGPAAGGGAASKIAEAIRHLGRGHAVAIFPEIGPPARPPRLRRISAGVAHISARSSAVVVPVLFGGTDELYLGRRIEVRVLPPVVAPATTFRPSIIEWTEAFEASAQAAANDAHERANVNAPLRKHWRWLTGNYPRVD